MSAAPSTVTISTGRNAYGAVYNTVVTNPQRLTEEQNQVIDKCFQMNGKQCCLGMGGFLLVGSILSVISCASLGCLSSSSQATVKSEVCDIYCPAYLKVGSIIVLVSAILISCGACIVKKW